MSTFFTYCKKEELISSGKIANINSSTKSGQTISNIITPNNVNSNINSTSNSVNLADVSQTLPSRRANLNTITAITSQTDANLQIILQSTQYNVQTANFSMDLLNAYMIEYANEPQKLIVIPIIQDNNKISKAYVAKLINNQNTDNYLLEFSGNEQYNQIVGTNPIFFDFKNIPFSGNFKLNKIIGQGNSVALEQLVNIPFVDNTPTWIRHGGYGSWSACVKGNYGETWAIIGSVIAPAAILIGISLGCA